MTTMNRRPWSWLRIVGAALMTTGLVLSAVLIYQFWWTTHVSRDVQEQTATDLQQQWSERPTLEQPTETAVPEADASPVRKPRMGDPFALMFIPRLSDDVWRMPILSGVGERELAAGIGYYRFSDLPGQVGNFAVAGHRATNGEPLANVDRLQRGDLVVIRTRDAWHTYRLTRDRIVKPEDVWVISDNPFPAQERTARITITTCHPRWASTYRWIWWGELVETTPVGQGPPAAVASRP